jgi:hypothetical protein
VAEYLLQSIDETESQPEDIRLSYQFIEGLDPLTKALVLLYLDGNMTSPSFCTTVKEKVYIASKRTDSGQQRELGMALRKPYSRTIIYSLAHKFDLAVLAAFC